MDSATPLELRVCSVYAGLRTDKLAKCPARQETRSDRTRQENKVTTHPDKPPSTRSEQHDAMLKEALARPGVREVMEVYGAWRQIDRELNTYRAATKRAPTITTTDHANAQ